MTVVSKLRSRQATSFRLDTELDKKLKKVAIREDLTKSDIMRRALRFYFASQNE